MEQDDMVDNHDDYIPPAVAVHDIDVETAVLVSETDAAELHSHSFSPSSSSSVSSSPFSEGETDSREEGYHEKFTTCSWLSSSSMQNHLQRKSDNCSVACDEETMNSGSAIDYHSKDDLYCENMDDEDEAWVYQHLRSGGEGAEKLINDRHPRQLSQHQGGGLQSRAEKYACHTHAKKMRGINDESHKKLDTHESELLSQELENHTEHPIGSYDERSNNNRESLHNPSSTMSLVKPRSSDAILSCPSCFNILCMDCQQHEKYANQYRAMFVMNIGVDWSRKMVYDDLQGCLKLFGGDDTKNVACDILESVSSGDELLQRPRDDEYMLDDNNVDDDTNDARVFLGERINRHPDTIPDEQQESHNDTEKEDAKKSDFFYSVHCGYCRNEVAALDMNDEIYYFFGCIASA